jgi:hypothetical protein
VGSSTTRIRLCSADITGMAWSHAITRDQPLQPDECQCRRCGRAFLPDGARRVYCSAACSAKPVRTAEGRARSEGSRGTSTQRGYGTEHQRERQRQLAELEADGSRPCPICDRPMHVGQLLDLDHVQSIALGGVSGRRQLAHNGPAIADRRRPAPASVCAVRNPSQSGRRVCGEPQFVAHRCSTRSWSSPKAEIFASGR